MARIETLLLTGANNHDWTRSAPFCAELLEASGKFEVTLTEDPSSALENMEALCGYQLLFSDYNGPEWSEKAKANFEAVVRGGTGLVILHAADNAFKGWVEYEKMVALMWREGTGHGAYHEFEVKIVDDEHPITRGLDDFFLFRGRFLLRRRLRHVLNLFGDGLLFLFWLFGLLNRRDVCHKSYLDKVDRHVDGAGALRNAHKDVDRSEARLLLLEAFDHLVAI